MQPRFRRRTSRRALASLGAAIVLASCVGDDPSLVDGPTPGPEGGSLSDGPVGYEAAAPLDGGVDATEGGAGPAARLVFVTKNAFPVTHVEGNGGFDDQCNTAAAGSTKAAVRSATFAAWVSTIAANAASHAHVVGFTGSYRMPDGTLIAKSGADLLDGTIAAFLDRDESGAARAAGTPWTGTTADGTVDADVEGTCADWTLTSIARHATRGTTTETNARWTKSGAASCSEANPIFCFQVP